MTRTLSVWWDGVVVGTLQVNQHGQMRFTCATDWLADASRPAISFSLPRQEQAFTQRQCRPFFAGLLPEEAQRDVIAEALGISKGNDFAFLEALGGDVAGALSLWPEGEVPPAPEPTGTPRPLSDDELAEVLDTLPRRPLLAGREGLRLSLAGAQTKLPVVLVDDRVALPAPGQPTTHILKPAIARFPHTTENEALVMTLAAAVGLPVTPVTARSVESRPYLLVSRYDRRFDASGQTHRLHQDDFCQALGIVPERKYAAEGGPTFKSGFDLLRRATTIPAVAVLAFVDAAIFNLIVGNADAHGKNFSLLYQGADMSLAPFYDLLSTVAYSDLSPKLAMKIAKRATIEEIGPTTWPAFSDDIGMPVRFVRRRVVELAEAVPDKPNLDLNRTEFIEGPLRREDGTHGTPSKHSPEVRDRAFGWSLTTPPSIRWDRVNKREGAAHSTAGRRAPAWSGDGQPAQFRHGRIRGAPLPCRFARARPITRATRH